MKADGPRDRRTAGEGEDWATWVSFPEEGMQRASHVLAADASFGDDGGLWLVDPVDADDLDEWLADRGRVAGVVVLFERHARDADAIAQRHDVAVHLPAQLRGVADRFSVPVETFADELDETGYHVHPVVDRDLWNEAALYDPDRGTLVVPETVGTASYFRAGDERLGVHPALRAFPPRAALRDLAPERVLCGHGDPVPDDAADDLADALANARRRLPRAWAGAVRRALPI